MLAYIPIRGILYTRTGEPTDNKKKDRKNTMKKEMYKQILHTTKRPETLDEIIRSAMGDNDIKPKDFAELLKEMNKIIMKGDNRNYRI